MIKTVVAIPTCIASREAIRETSRNRRRCVTNTSPTVKGGRNTRKTPTASVSAAIPNSSGVRRSAITHIETIVAILFKSACVEVNPVPLAAVAVSPVCPSRGPTDDFDSKLSLILSDAPLNLNELPEHSPQLATSLEPNIPAPTYE